MYAPPDFYRPSTTVPITQKLVLLLHAMTVVCLLALTICAVQALQAYQKDVDFRTQPPPVAAVEPKSCTTEQALQWWSGSKDLNTVRAKLCGIKAPNKHKGKSS